MLVDIFSFITGAQHLRTDGYVSLSNSDPESPIHLLDAQTSTRGVAGSDNRVPPSGIPSNYRSIGKCEHICEYCGALFWYEERLKSVGRNRRPKYGRCCKGGRVALRTYQIYPEYIKLLLQDRHFMENIRAYNQMFSMTSLGAHIDESVNNGRGPYVFKIFGQLYHWLGSLCPAEGEPPCFLQLYIYDTDNEVDNRMSHFGGQNSDLRRDIVEGLIDMLDTHNALVHLFRTAREKLADTHIPNFKVRLYNVVGAREYELPTARIHRDEDIDAYVSVELPSIDTDPEYHRIVSELMMHGLCGLACPSASCTQNTTECRKHFRKEYCNRTYTDKDGFVHYRLRDTEYYGWTMLIKYLFKYISKGTDRIAARISKNQSTAYESTSRIELGNIGAVVVRGTGHQSADLSTLWKRVWRSMSEYIPYTSSISLNIPNLHIDDSHLEDDVLYELEGCVNHCLRSLIDFGMRLPPEDLMSVLRNRLLMEKKSYNRELVCQGKGDAHGKVE
ncbi:hypothetical protein Tco_0573855 [Tanacetum coccineum]